MSTSSDDLQNFKKEFLASVSHELRTPLSVIMGYVQILREKTPGPLTAEQEKCLETIYNRADELLRVMTQLLAAKDMVEGKKFFKMGSLDLRAFLAERLSRPQREQTRKRMTLEQALGDEPVWVNADAQKLGDVVDNLLLNAFKFGAEQSVVRVELSSDGRAASVRVRNAGNALTLKQRRDLFEMFSATEQGLAREYGGLGLGLFLCKETLKYHGGSIAASDAQDAQGFTVTFTLPVGAKLAETQTTPAAAVQTRRVLIIEDDMDFLQLLVIFLSRLGSHIVPIAAESGAAALKEAALQTPDLIILDLMLPGMDGLSILQCLKSERKTANTPILIVSGYEKAASKAEQAGAQDVLIKPFDETLFVSKVSALLDKAKETKTG